MTTADNMDAFGENNTETNFEEQNQSLNKAFELEFKGANTPAVKEFLSTQPAGGTIRTLTLLLSARRYKFMDKDNDNKEICGVTLTVTDGVVVDNNNNDIRGLTINKHTLAGPGYYDKFNMIRTPPTPVILDLRITDKKTSVVKMYTCEDINKKADINKNTTEGGPKSQQKK